MSGQAEGRRKAVASPAATMAKFATASLRAERKAALVKLPLWLRKRASIKAQVRLIARAPSPVSVRAKGSGGIGALILVQIVQSVARPGIRRMPASTMPSRVRLRALQPKAIRISRLTEASSRK